MHKGIIIKEPYYKSATSCRCKTLHHASYIIIWFLLGNNGMITHLLWISITDWTSMVNLIMGIQIFNGSLFLSNLQHFDGTNNKIKIKTICQILTHRTENNGYRISEAMDHKILF